MDDIVGHVVLAGGDENLLAGDGVRAVALRDRAGLEKTEIRSAMGLGQAHRARPFAGRHFRQIAGLEIVVCVRHQRRDGAIGQTGVHRECDIGGIFVLAEQNCEKRRQALAAVGLIAGQTDPAALDQRLIGLLEAFRGRHAAVVMARAAFGVADAIERLDDLLDKLGAFGQHRLDDVERRVGKAGSVGFVGVVEHVAQQKNGVADRRFVCRHFALERSRENPPKRRPRP